MKGTVPCGSAHSDCQKKKKKISLQTLEKSHFLELKWVKLHQAEAFISSFFLGDYFWVFFRMRFLTFWKNSLESCLALGMTLGVFFFLLSSENVWKYFRGQQASRHHVKGQFRGRVASPAASTLPSFNRHVCHIVGKRGPERQEARQSGIYSIWERESTEIFKGSNMTRVKMNRNIGEKLK